MVGPVQGADAAPNQTIYVSNLNEKIKKEGKRPPQPCRGCYVLYRGVPNVAS